MMKRLFSLAMLLIFGLAACNINTPDVTPTAEILISDTPTSEVVSSATPSITPSLTATREVVDVPVVVASPLPSQSISVPTLDAEPSPTVGPCAETVQEND